VKNKSVKAKKSDNRQLTGTISINTKGVGFFDIPETERTLEIQPENLNRAFHGDMVEVISLGKKRGSKGKQDREQGRVTKIISRAKNKFVGIVEKRKI